MCTRGYYVYQRILCVPEDLKMLGKFYIAPTWSRLSIGALFVLIVLSLLSSMLGLANYGETWSSFRISLCAFMLQPHGLDNLVRSPLLLRPLASLCKA